MIKVLGIIPARGGSKGVPGKNIKMLCGKPLLAYTAESALGAKRLTRTILSTDDPEIAKVGRSLGLDVPFMRPAELATDTSPTFPVVLHALTTLETQGEIYDAVCLLQPTNPLRRSEDIDNCIDLWETSGADSVISIMPVPETYNPKWVYFRSLTGEMVLATGDVEPVKRRQDLPAAFHRDGSIYITSRNVLDEFGNLYGTNVRGYEIDSQRCVNIDTDEDWALAERTLNLDNALTSANGSRKVAVQVRDR
jgi:CMP-N-acetylneuraminic acid synthetase